MITIPFNKKINGNLLTQELAAAGLVTDVVVMPGELLELNGLENADSKAAAKVLEAHVAPETIEPSIEQKLATAGVSILDLKDALGL